MEQGKHSAEKSSQLIIDARAHIGGPPLEAKPDNFIRLLKNSKVDKAAVFRYVSGHATRVGNEFIWAAVSKHLNHLIGFAWIDPNDDIAISEARTAVVDWKFKGIKLHLGMSAASVDRLTAVFAETESLQVPLCIHLGEDWDAVNQLCGQYDINIIVAHMGTGVYNLDPARLEKAIALLMRHDKVYLETSGNTYFFIEHAVKRLGPTKVIFGSDFPHEHPSVMAKAIELLDLPAGDRELILGHNLSKLIGIS